MKTVTRSKHLIEDIAEYLSEDLAHVDSHIKAVLDSDTALVREVGNYALSNKGKKLRPILLILASRACGYEGEEHARVAAALEIIHTATLIHDDVIDKAVMRRGKPSVNTRWGDDVAILIADYLYASAFRLSTLSLSPAILSTICQVTAKMCEGEMFQIEKRDMFLTREDYLRIVRGKTAFLFSACTGLGSILAQAGESETLGFTKFGLNFGIAFQITDDALDISSRDSDLGKDSGTDIRNGKQTLPLIHAYENATPKDRGELEACWNNGRNPQCVLGYIRKYQGLDYAFAQAKEFAATAREQLAFLKPGIETDYFHQLSEYVAERTR